MMRSKQRNPILKGFPANFLIRHLEYPAPRPRNFRSSGPGSRGYWRIPICLRKSSYDEQSSSPAPLLEDINIKMKYLEWFVTRDATSQKITRIDYTCEGPEYWDFLATHEAHLAP